MADAPQHLPPPPQEASAGTRAATATRLPAATDCHARQRTRRRGQTGGPPPAKRQPPHVDTVMLATRMTLISSAPSPAESQTVPGETQQGPRPRPTTGRRLWQPRPTGPCLSGSRRPTRQSRREECRGVEPRRRTKTRGDRGGPPFQSALGPGGESALQRPNRCNELPWTLHPEGHQCLAKLAKSLGGAEAAARGKKEVHHPTWMDG